MISGHLSDWRKLMPDPAVLLEKGFAAIESHAGNPPEDGRYDIEGDDVYLIVQRYPTKGLKDGFYEAHRKYIDIQYVASGAERLGILGSEGLRVAEEYDDGKDCILYDIPPDEQTYEALDAGHYAVLFPEDVHLPARHSETGPADVIKFVAKVRIT